MTLTLNLSVISQRSARGSRRGLRDSVLQETLFDKLPEEGPRVRGRGVGPVKTQRLYIYIIIVCCFTADRVASRHGSSLPCRSQLH